MPNYSNHFVCFLDILGFKKLIKSNKTDKIHYYTTIFNHLKKDWLSKQNTKSTLNFNFFAFSDSLLITVEDKNDKDKRILLENLCIAVTELQYHLAQVDIWTRGGISYGELSLSDISDNKEDGIIAFGPSIIDAYELESIHAKYPRVILGSKALNICNFPDRRSAIEYLNSVDKRYKMSPQNIVFDWFEDDDVRRGKMYIEKDTLLFLDYLYPLTKLNEENFDSFLKTLKTNLDNPNNFRKYQWVLDYLKSLSAYQLKNHKQAGVAFSRVMKNYVKLRNL